MFRPNFLAATAIGLTTLLAAPAVAQQPQHNPPNHATKPQDGEVSREVLPNGMIVITRRVWVWDGHRWVPKEFKRTIAGQPKILPPNANQNMLNFRPQGNRDQISPPAPQGSDQVRLFPQPGTERPPLGRQNLFTQPQPEFPLAEETLAPAPATETAMRVTDIDDGPAQRAGVQEGDIIVTVDGTRVRQGGDIRSVLQQSVGRVAFVFFRPSTGQTFTASVEAEDAKLGVSVEVAAIRFTQPGE